MRPAFLFYALASTRTRSALRVRREGLRSSLGDASSCEYLNHQRDDRKNQKKMNQKARDMVHDKASDPREQEQNRYGQPDKTAHTPSNEILLQYEPD
jgi:hypothetical protein